MSDEEKAIIEDCCARLEVCARKIAEMNARRKSEAERVARYREELGIPREREEGNPT